jgi:hypothetical protein
MNGHARRTKVVREQRFDFPMTIDYKIVSPGNGVAHKAVCINISKDGLGAYMFAPHAEGEKIVITSVLPVSNRTATVRWIKKEENSLYLTGLKFTDQ